MHAVNNNSVEAINLTSEITTEHKNSDEKIAHVLLTFDRKNFSMLP